MQNKTIQVKFDIPLEYLIGHLRYGHREGIIELTKEEFEKLKRNPINFIYDYDILCNLELIVDDYCIDDCGPISEVNYEVIDNAE